MMGRKERIAIVIGLTLVVAGVAAVSSPAALVVAGIILVALAVTK